MHPVARTFQILFLLAGLGMFGYAIDESASNGKTSPVSFRYECTTVNTGTTERPTPKETCQTLGTNTYYAPGTDEVMVSALAGLGLMVGAAAVSIGSARRAAGVGVPAAVPAAVPQQNGMPGYGAAAYPAPPGQAPRA
ncbi:hypothetical protein ACIBI4_08865 [Streptomyces sp. NPDC050418]|uniref:hypothetical protein n=1 Tax=Streptomyces sp. NPDC050418 TaxID=3365612 RepID=UPI0037A1F678